MSRRRLVLVWVAATACAETVGYAAAAILFAVPGGPVVGGLVEGTALGVAQGMVLRRYVRDFPLAAWLGVTALIAAAGWGSASAFSAGGGAGEPPAAVMVLGAAGLGAGMGMLLGAGQWLALRQRFVGAWTWIPASAIGWGIGMVPAFAVATAPQSVPDAVQLLGLGAGGGALMGLAVGAVTGWQLARLSRKQHSVRRRVEGA